MWVLILSEQELETKIMKRVELWPDDGAILGHRDLVVMFQ